MASAYATLAASGIYRQPHFVTKVETNDGTVLFNRKPDPGKRVFAAKVADNVTAALEPIAGYSNGNSLYDPTYGYRPSAAKTGTAQLGDTGQNKDAWMVGYTPQLSTAVWVGTDKGTALKNSWAARCTAQVCPRRSGRRRWTARLEGQPIKQFPTPKPSEVRPACPTRRHRRRPRPSRAPVIATARVCRAKVRRQYHRRTGYHHPAPGGRPHSVGARNRTVRSSAVGRVRAGASDAESPRRWRPTMIGLCDVGLRRCTIRS